MLGQSAFATFDSFTVAVELMPLLIQEIKVNYVVLSNLNLAIEKMKDGKTNFDVASVKKPVKADSNATAQASEPTQLPLVNVTEVRVQNANISYIDHISKLKSKCLKHRCSHQRYRS